MDIKYFRLIKAITEEGNIANSSEKLFLTQSALSHQLRELELWLGFKVFRRKRNLWELTDEGKELYKLGNEVLGTIDKGFKAIEKIRSGSLGVIKVSTECYSFYQGLPSFIQKMGVLYPDTEVELILEATHRPIEKILAKKIDIAIVTAPPVEEGLVAVRVAEDEIFMLVHQEHPLNRLKHIEASDFAAEHLIIHSFPIETVSVYEQFLKLYNVKPAKVSAIPLTEVALEMVNANMGVMCMPKWALRAFKLPQDLVFKRIGAKGLKRIHYLVVRTEDAEKKYVMDFISNFQEEFS